MELKKFIWIGKNRKFGDIWVSPPMTTTDLLKGNYLSFFGLGNRDESKNCEFMMECFEGDTLFYETKTSQSDIEIKFEDDKVLGIGAFNILPLTDFLNADDFVSITLYPF